MRDGASDAYEGEGAACRPIRTWVIQRQPVLTLQAFLDVRRGEDAPCTKRAKSFNCGPRYRELESSNRHCNAGSATSTTSAEEVVKILQRGDRRVLDGRGYFRPRSARPSTAS